MIFVTWIKKAKTAKDVLDKKAAASIAAPTLQFLQAEKQKHVCTTGLNSCWPDIAIFAIKKARTILGYIGQVLSIPHTS